jgi:deazaflavin-dependent oxidoreductase (nitroreductase family)
MSKIAWNERISVWLEVEILGKLTPKDHVGPIFKWIFKIPILYYKLGLGWMLRKRFLLLTTTGRRTGKPRHTPLEFDYNPQTDCYRVSPGWGGNTDWYKNVLHDPHVRLQVGGRKFAALAEPVDPQEAAKFMQAVSARHPGMDKVWNRWSDKPVNGTLEGYLHAARFFPSVRLKPIEEKLV